MFINLYIKVSGAMIESRENFLWHEEGSLYVLLVKTQRDASNDPLVLGIPVLCCYIDFGLKCSLVY